MSALEPPPGLHPVWESYVPVIQTRFPASSWDKRWLAKSADQVLVETAKKSNPWTPQLLQKIDGFKVPTCSYLAFEGALFTGRCWRGDPAVDDITGKILLDAYQSTASYLYVALKALP